MRVVFLPIWPGNPYHVELEKALRPLGVNVLPSRSLKDLCRNYKAGVDEIDLVHLHTLPHLHSSPRGLARYVSFYLRVRWLRKKGVRFLWTIHDLDNHEARHRGIENFFARFLASRLEATIVHGNSAREIIRSRWGSRVPKYLRVIPHGHYLNSYKNEITSEAARAHFGFDRSDFVFLFLGQIRPYKGVVEMVEAFRAYADSHLRLIIAGKPMNPAIANEVAASIQGDSRIQFFPGQVPDDDVQVYMNACDVVTLPYRRIFTSGAAVLAMSFGKPCIAPRAGCVIDMLDEEGAVFFDPLVDKDLERVLREIVASRRKLPSMGLHNLHRVAAWDWQEIARLTLAVYRRCLAGSPGCHRNCNSKDLSLNANI